MQVNGVHHNESAEKRGTYLKGKRSVIFLDDFELVNLNSGLEEYDVKNALKIWKEDHTFYFNPDRVLRLLPRKTAEQGLQMIVEGIRRMEERFVAMPSVGPARPLINAIANMQDISEIITT
jgi:hypothetical protein